MELDRIIPSGEWKVSNNRAFVKNIAWLPVFDIVSNNRINIFLDIRNAKNILKVTKNLKKTDIEFYFISPLFADPGQDISEYNLINVKNYLRNFSKSQFFDGFSKIEFNFIGNLIDYCKKENCIELVKEVYDLTNKDVQRKYWDYYSGKEHFNNKREDIREYFNILYREIQLQQILR
jgi:hypothetical protein